MNRQEYEADLQRRKQEHLKNVARQGSLVWRPCMHDQCPECVGTGITRDGTACIHYLSCPCLECSPSIVITLSPERFEDRSYTEKFAVNLPVVPRAFYQGLRRPQMGTEVSGELGYTGGMGLPYIQLD